MQFVKLSLVAVVVASLASNTFAADTLADAFKNGKVIGVGIENILKEAQVGKTRTETNAIIEGVKQVRQSEIQEMEQRIATFQQTAYTDLQKKQQELVNPVIEKVRKAITDVATENKYTYIFDMSSQVILYTAPNSNDITALVKKKLGLK